MTLDYRTIREDDTKVAERYPGEGRAVSADDDRLDMAEFIFVSDLGRPLKASERVWHQNGNVLDNRRANLILVDVDSPLMKATDALVAYVNEEMQDTVACHDGVMHWTDAAASVRENVRRFVEAHPILTENHDADEVIDESFNHVRLEVYDADRIEHIMGILTADTADEDDVWANLDPRTLVPVSGHFVRNAESMDADWWYEASLTMRAIRGEGDEPVEEVTA